MKIYCVVVSPSNSNRKYFLKISGVHLQIPGDDERSSDNPRSRWTWPLGAGGLWHCIGFLPIYKAEARL